MTTFQQGGQQTPLCQSTTDKGFPVRTNLRAGLAWDDLDDKAKELWSKVTSTVSNAASALTAGNSAAQPKA